MTGKVILNYDGLDIAARYPDAIIQSYNPGVSHAKYFMADTVHMKRRTGMTQSAMFRLAKDAAPLAEKVVIEDLPDNPSYDNSAGKFRPRMYAHA